LIVEDQAISSRQVSIKAAFSEMLLPQVLQSRHRMAAIGIQIAEINTICLYEHKRARNLE
jgi:hypothetical protein